MAIRLATAADIPAIVRVINCAYRVEDFFVYGDRTSEPEIIAKFGSHNARFLVIDSQDSIAAVVYVMLRGSRGYFAMLSVDPDHQGRGFARALVHAAEDHCRAAGCEFMDIEVVDVRAELPAFYTALGYLPVDTKPFPEPDKLKSPAHMVRWTKPLVTPS